MNKFFNTISFFTVIAILSLLTACPPETPDNIPTDHYNTKAPTFDYKVINKSISGLEEDLTSDLYYQDTVKLGKICFKASLGKSISDDSGKLAELAQDILQYDPPITINSDYNGYFFYLEKKFYFDCTNWKFTNTVENTTDAIIITKSCGISGDEYNIAKQSFKEKSLLLLTPMMEEINTALGNTKYSFKINDLDNIEITAFKETFKLSGLDGNQQSTCSWIQVLLAYCFNKDIDLLSSLKASTDLSSYFTDYPNINNFYNALQDEVKKFSD